MDIQFIAGFAAISPDLGASATLYRDVLGLPLEGDDYPSTDAIDGTRHFGVWPLEAAARSCFGSEQWPDDTPVPQATIEFELATTDAVAAGASELEEAGYRLIHEVREEPWGQTVARVLSPEGLLIGLSFAPWMH
jgi:catechol 2,3-dioxygenase-like lactoylglutathione lyase family enzyme